jgi:hypothetical protein
VDGAGHEFLPGARFPVNQHGAGTGGNGGKHFKNLLHQYAAADEFAHLKAALEFASQGVHFTHVAKGLCTANHLAGMILENGGGDTDGQPRSICANDISRFANDGFAGPACLVKGAFSLAHTGPKDLRATPADGLLARHAGDLFGGTVERCDPPA